MKLSPYLSLITTMTSKVNEYIQLFSFHDYEHELVGNHSAGKIVTVRCISEGPEKVYLEVAPLSKLSTISLLVATVLALCLSLSP